MRHLWRCCLTESSLTGVGIDGGNSKDWETNARSIQLIKQRGKVKALDEEIHSKSQVCFIFYCYLFIIKGGLYRPCKHTYEKQDFSLPSVQSKQGTL